VPRWQPQGTGRAQPRRDAGGGSFRTQHTGLPDLPAATGRRGKAGSGRRRKSRPSSRQ
jgi:hypothetical protein